MWWLNDTPRVKSIPWTIAVGEETAVDHVKSKQTPPQWPRTLLLAAEWLIFQSKYQHTLVARSRLAGHHRTHRRWKKWFEYLSLQCRNLHSFSDPLWSKIRHRAADIQPPTKAAPYLKDTNTQPTPSAVDNFSDHISCGPSSGPEPPCLCVRCQWRTASRQFSMKERSRRFWASRGWKSSKSLGPWYSN